MPELREGAIAQGIVSMCTKERSKQGGGGGGGGVTGGHVSSGAGVRSFVAIVAMSQGAGQLDVVHDPLLDLARAHERERERESSLVSVAHSVCTCSDTESLVLWDLANTQIHPCIPDVGSKNTRGNARAGGRQRTPGRARFLWGQARSTSSCCGLKGRASCGAWAPARAPLGPPLAFRPASLGRRAPLPPRAPHRRTRCRHPFNVRER